MAAYIVQDGFLKCSVEFRALHYVNVKGRVHLADERLGSYLTNMLSAMLKCYCSLPFNFIYIYKIWQMPLLLILYINKTHLQRLLVDMTHVHLLMYIVEFVPD